MNNPNQELHAHNNKPRIGSARKDYPSEVEEVYRQDSQHPIPEISCEPAREQESSLSPPA